MLFTNQCSLLLLIKKTTTLPYDMHEGQVLFFLEFDLLFNDLTI